MCILWLGQNLGWIDYRFENKGKDKMQSNEKQKNLRSLSKGTNSQTERRFLTKSEQEERRQIQREMMDRLRELRKKREMLENLNILKTDTQSDGK